MIIKGKQRYSIKPQKSINQPILPPPKPTKSVMDIKEKSKTISETRAEVNKQFNIPKQYKTKEFLQAEKLTKELPLYLQNIDDIDEL